MLLCGVSALAFGSSKIAGNLHGVNNTSDLLATLVDSNVTSDPFYMLLLGTDAVRRIELQVGYHRPSRIDPKNKQVTLISIPRDTRVTLSNGETAKINSAHALGGPDDVVKAVNELCGIEISHYAEVSFEGMQQLVDAIGGV